MEDKKPENENNKPAPDPGPIAQWERELDAVKKAIEEKQRKEDSK